MIVDGRCKINVITSMTVDEDLAMTGRALGEDMERWDYVEEQYRGGGHLHVIITHTSTDAWSKHNDPIHCNSSTLVALE
jgi:hypothetical protein